MAIQSELLAAINQIAHERRIDPNSVVEALKLALVAAYRKDYFGDTLPTDIRAEVNPDTSEIKIIAVKEVIADKDVVDAMTQMGISEAQKLVASLKIGDKIELELPISAGFGRIAAQTAKQVILQKIREAEKDAIVEEFKDKIGTIVSGNVQRVLQGNVIAEIGKATGVMPAEEKIYQEYYKTGETYKFLLKDVISKQLDNNFSAQFLLSRAEPKFLSELFAVEVPEITSGIVEIKGIAREAGSRSKVSVSSNQQGVDPIGSCVGQKGMRILNIQNELSDNSYEEKIDIIEWHEDPAQYVANALSPAKVEDVVLNKKTETAYVYVAEDQLSLAIGKEGQNVRLAHKLTNWKIEINPENGPKTDEEAEAMKGKRKITNKPKKDAKKPAAKVTKTVEKTVEKKVTARKVSTKKKVETKSKIVAKKTSKEVVKKATKAVKATKTVKKATTKQSSAKKATKSKTTKSKK